MVRKPQFRAAWISFASIPISHFIFTLVKLALVYVYGTGPSHAVGYGARSANAARRVEGVELFSDGLVWLLLGISLIALINSLVPNGASSSGTTSNKTPSDRAPGD
ncbi:MAG: hypothetical protein JRJ87_26670 [Deltaproteobacteria bacterium]|nr:hypothetical protein [Deltaproteobacteria bacterium]